MKAMRLGALMLIGGVGCGSSSGPTHASDDGGGQGNQDATHPADTGSRDVASQDRSSSDGGGSDAKAKDAASDVVVGDGPAADGGAGMIQCFEILGSGPGETCGYSASTMPCAAGTSPGTCPSSGLVGCCVDTLSSGVAAICYYAAAAASSAMALCTGSDQTWVTTSP
jgi:hypothetical protein